MNERADERTTVRIGGDRGGRSGGRGGGGGGGGGGNGFAPEELNDSLDVNGHDEDGRLYGAFPTSNQPPLPMNGGGGGGGAGTRHHHHHHHHQNHNHSHHQYHHQNPAAHRRFGSLGGIGDDEFLSPFDTMVSHMSETLDDSVAQARWLSNPRTVHVCIGVVTTEL